MTAIQRATPMPSRGGRAFRTDGRGALALFRTAEGIGMSRGRPIVRATLVEAVLLLGPAELAAILGRVGAENSVVVLRVLEIVFRRNAIAGCRRIARQSQIFLQNLTGRTTDFYVWAGAVEGLGS